MLTVTIWPPSLSSIWAETCAEYGICEIGDNMKSFGEWMKDMAGTIPDASEIKPAIEYDDRSVQLDSSYAPDRIEREFDNRKD